MPIKSKKYVVNVADDGRNGRDVASESFTNHHHGQEDKDTEKLTSFNGTNNNGSSKFPQVYGDVSLTPSTPGAADESKFLMKKSASSSNGTKLLNGFEPMVEEEPPDRFHLVYIIFLINGVSTLMPWNMFITANDYFIHYKFGGTDAEYSKNFMSYLGICSQLPNLLLNLINAFAPTSGNLGRRVIASLCVLILMMLFTILLAMIDTSSWPGIFFGLTMLTVFICNGAVGLYQNCVYGMAASFPMKYSGAVILGSNISGVLTTLISLISMLVTPNYKMAAVYYFTTALFIVLLSFDSYFILPRCKFYKYHQRLHNAHTSQADLKRVNRGGFRGYMQPYVHVFKKAWVQMFNIFFIFFVSLTIFPAMQTSTKPSDENFFLSGKFFNLFTCFMTFNVFAMIGNLVPSWLPNPGPKFLWLPILLRGLLLPFFFFSNYRPSCRTWPVLFLNDYVYTFMGIVLGFTSGYFSSLVMMYAPRLVDKAYARPAAMLATFFLILGIVCGVNGSLFVAYAVENLGPIAANSTHC